MEERIEERMERWKEGEREAVWQDEEGVRIGRTTWKIESLMKK